VTTSAGSARRELHVQVPEGPQGQPEFGEVCGRPEVATADLFEPAQPVGKGVGVDVQGRRGGSRLSHYTSKLNAGLLSSSGPDVFESQLNIDQVKSGQVVALDDIIGDTKSDYT
jgi:hypothetical protein